MAACVATSRQVEETPATTASETATNPGPLGKRRAVGGCLYTYTHTYGIKNDKCKLVTDKFVALKA